MVRSKAKADGAMSGQDIVAVAREQSREYGNATA